MRGLKVLAVLLLAAAGLAIDQSCPCPANSLCLSSNNMCACNSGFIGDCSTAAPVISTVAINVTIAGGGAQNLFEIDPIDLDQYLEFTFNLCLPSEQYLTMALYAETGDTTTYNGNNQLGNTLNGYFDSGCQPIRSPYISFGSQPNGQNDLLVLGISATGPSFNATLSVSQQAIIGVFLYYYVLIAITAIIAVVIAIGIGVFIYRQRMRRRNAPLVPAEAREYNDIDHFQNLMPMFAAEQLGSDRSICPICLQQIEAAEVVRQTPCYHVFHTSCIDSWGLKNLSCPVCRNDLSFVGMGASNRIRNSTIRMDVPPDEDDWEVQREKSKKGDTMLVEMDETPKAAL
jgi:hypothetical protein